MSDSESYEFRSYLNEISRQLGQFFNRGTWIGSAEVGGLEVLRPIYVCRGVNSSDMNRYHIGWLSIERIADLSAMFGRDTAISCPVTAIRILFSGQEITKVLEELDSRVDKPIFPSRTEKEDTKDLKDTETGLSFSETSGFPLDTFEDWAAMEHTQWSMWTKWMLDCLRDEMKTHFSQSTFEAFPCVQRWRRQIATPYSDLTEKEKDSDREWALIRRKGMK